MDVNLLAGEMRPLHRSEYDRLVAMGAFDEERLELLYGVLVRMSPQGALHANVLSVLMELLTAALGGRARIRAHSPLALSENSEPEPDLAVVPLADYTDRHPSEAFLVIEAADSSLRRDRQVKARLYAESVIPEYWLINLAERVVEVHSAPKEGIYTQTVVKSRGDRLQLDSFPDVQIAVEAFLPPRE